MKRIDDADLTDTVEVDKEGNEKVTKSYVARAREEEHQTAWMVRLFIFIAGLFGSFLLVLGAGSLTMFAARRRRQSLGDARA